MSPPAGVKRECDKRIPREQQAAALDHDYGEGTSSQQQQTSPAGQYPSLLRILQSEQPSRRTDMEQEQRSSAPYRPQVDSSFVSHWRVNSDYMPRDSLTDDAQGQQSHTIPRETGPISTLVDYLIDTTSGNIPPQRPPAARSLTPQPNILSLQQQVQRSRKNLTKQRPQLQSLLLPNNQLLEQQQPVAQQLQPQPQPRPIPLAQSSPPPHQLFQEPHAPQPQAHLIPTHQSIRYDIRADMTSSTPHVTYYNVPQEFTVPTNSYPQPILLVRRQMPPPNVSNTQNMQAQQQTPMQMVQVRPILSHVNQPPIQSHPYKTYSKETLQSQPRQESFHPNLVTQVANAPLPPHQSEPTHLSPQLMHHHYQQQTEQIVQPQPEQNPPNQNSSHRANYMPSPIELCDESPPPGPQPSTLEPQREEHASFSEIPSSPRVMNLEQSQPPTLQTNEQVLVKVVRPMPGEPTPETRPFSSPRPQINISAGSSSRNDQAPKSYTNDSGQFSPSNGTDETRQPSIENRDGNKEQPNDYLTNSSEKNPQDAQPEQRLADPVAGTSKSELETGESSKATRRYKGRRTKQTTKQKNIKPHKRKSNNSKPSTKATNDIGPVEVAKPKSKPKREPTKDGLPICANFSSWFYGSFWKTKETEKCKNIFEDYQDKLINDKLDTDHVQFLTENLVSSDNHPLEILRYYTLKIEKPDMTTIVARNGGIKRGCPLRRKRQNTGPRQLVNFYLRAHQALIDRRPMIRKQLKAPSRALEGGMRGDVTSTSLIEPGENCDTSEDEAIPVN